MYILRRSSDKSQGERDTPLLYKFLIHFFPLGVSVYNHNKPTITAQMLKNIAIISIIYYFRILLPILASPISINNPVRSIIHAAFSLNMLLSSKSISDKPITNEPNKVFDREKKYSASFSFRVLSLSILDLISFCCLDQLPISRLRLHL